MKSKAKKGSVKRTSKKRDPNRYPKGFDLRKVESIIDHYENQADEEAVAQDEAAYRGTTTTMQIPNELVPKVQQLIARHVK